MKDPVIIVWAILAFITIFWSRWCLKRYARSLDSVAPIHILAFALGSSALGCLMPILVKTELWSLWINRLVLLILGILQIWSLYRQTWIVRNKFDKTKDSLVVELSFTMVLAFLCSVCYVLSPRALGFFKLGKAMPDTGLWDAPLYFLLPFLVFKLADWASQIPFRTVEAPWFSPLETVNPEHWPWRDLTRVDFQIAESLLEEYTLFGRKSVPWIEVPRESPLGKVFNLTMDERRKKQGVRTIQDIGNEYDGAPKFWWIFSIKFIWWRPSTWFRRPRYLNPNFTIAKNQILNGDIVKARRISAENATMPANQPWSGATDFDPDKTIFIQR
jgi:hypothetical protein